MDLTREELLSALNVLDRVLGERGLRAELRVIGGAAIALKYNANRTTADVDSIFDNYSEVRAAIEATAAELQLEPDWINSQIHDLALPFDRDVESSPFVIGPNLTLWLGSPEFLLYTKIIATRRAEQDLEDAILLARHLGIENSQGIINAVSRFGEIDGALELYVEEIADELDR